MSLGFVIFVMLLVQVLATALNCHIHARSYEEGYREGYIAASQAVWKEALWKWAPPAERDERAWVLPAGRVRAQGAIW